jgi:ABC-type amino acid transport substrate-binding protein
MGKKDIVFDSLGDLKGYKVGAAGGSQITARILQGQGGDFEFVSFKDNNELLRGLERGDIQAAVIVGGQPLEIITKLSGDKFKLIPIGDRISGRVQQVYRKASLSYPQSRIHFGP